MRELEDSGAANVVPVESLPRSVSGDGLDATWDDDGTARRTAVGKQSKADVVMAIRAHQGAGPVADVVIFDAGSGVRLYHKQIAASAEVADSVKALMAPLRAAIGKRAEGITKVICVPPFNRQFPGRNMQVLEGAYARLLAAELVSRPGIVVVEETEAAALDARTDTGATYPIYLMGQFVREPDNASIRSGLTLVQHNRVIQTVPDAITLADDFASWLCNSAAGALNAAPAAISVASSERSAGLLQIGQSLRSQGELEASLEYTQAAMFLAPQSSAVYRQAIVGIRELPRMPKSGNGTLWGRQRLDEILENERLQNRYMLAWINTADLSKPEGDILNFIGGHGVAFEWLSGDMETIPKLRGVISERQKFLIEALESRAATARENHVPPDFASNFHTAMLPLAGRNDVDIELIRRTIKVVQDYPVAAQGIQTMLTMTMLGRNPNTRAAYDQLIVELEASQNPSLREAAESINRQRASMERQRKDNTPRILAGEEPPPAEEVQRAGVSNERKRVEFTKLIVSASDERGEPIEIPERFGQIVACGKGLDALASVHDLYLMREPGKLQRVLHLDDRQSSIGQCCFDGRYFWIPIRSATPQLTLLDPASGNIWRLTAKDGIRKSATAMGATPLEPGAVCLSGGEEGGWICKASFDPAKGLSQKLLWEANDFVGADQTFGKVYSTNPRIRFAPHWMITLVEPDVPNPRRRVLVGRIDQGSGGYYPLIVDPETPAVAVSPLSVSTILGYEASVNRGAMHFIGAGVTDGPDEGLYRLGFPELQRATLQTLPQRGGQIVFLNGAMNVAGASWWTFDESGKPLLADGSIPGVDYLRRFFVSSHYGLLMCTWRERDAGIYSFKLTDLRN